MCQLSNTLRSVFLSSLFIGAVTAAHSQDYASLGGDQKYIGTAVENKNQFELSAETNGGYINNDLAQNLLQFNATWASGNVLLNWEVVHDTEMSDFIVERSSNGSTWEAIDNIAVSPSNDFSSYQFTHFNVGSALNLYRLKITDADGRFAYSTVRSVAVKNEYGVELNVYPNPCTDKLLLEYQNIDKHDFVKIFITDGTGKLLQMSDWTLTEGTNKTSLLLKKLHGGTYFLTLRNNTNGAVMLQRKIIKN